eukprot:2002882-Alexandrium_andersonii.AAC.1
MLPMHLELLEAITRMFELLRILSCNPQAPRIDPAPPNTSDALIGVPPPHTDGGFQERTGATEHA